MTEGQGSWKRTTEMGQLRQDSHNRKLGHDIWDMTSAMTLDGMTQTGQSGQVGLTGQP
jgi:hypothetical protein